MNLSMGPNVTSEKVEIMDWGPQHEKQVILAEKENQIAWDVSRLLLRKFHK